MNDKSLRQVHKNLFELYHTHAKRRIWDPANYDGAFFVKVVNGLAVSSQTRP